MLGSSCIVLRTSNDSSNMLVQSRTAPPISSNLIVIALTCYSLTSGGVDGCAFNHSSTATCASVAAADFSYSTAFCSTSQSTCTSAAVVSFLHLSGNYAMCSLVSSFFFWAADFSISAMFGARHSDGHASKTLKMTSSLATKGSFVHYFIRSLCALIYMLCMSALNSVKLYKLL